LNLHAKAGETIGSLGIAEIGQTQQMYAVAEVYETDIRYIQLGQKATLSSEFGGFFGELTGTVDQIGLQIGRPGTVNRDPSAVSDVRVVQVKIRLNPEDSKKVKHLNQLQIRASIQI
jgi:HlyD family secretion protein